MTLEMIASTAMLAAFIWAVAFLLPRAVKKRDLLAVMWAVLTAVLALLGWLLIGVSAR